MCTLDLRALPPCLATPICASGQSQQGASIQPEGEPCSEQGHALTSADEAYVRWEKEQPASLPFSRLSPHVSNLTDKVVWGILCPCAVRQNRAGGRVAQLVRALHSHCRGQGFESLRAHRLGRVTDQDVLLSQPRSSLYFRQRPAWPLQKAPEGDSRLTG